MPNPTFHNLSEEKKERILNAAIKEFRVRNVREGNISNIVKDAKIARGSIYQYFPSKDARISYSPPMSSTRKRRFWTFFRRFTCGMPSFF